MNYIFLGNFEYLFETDVFFPILQSGLLWKPPNQDLLFDNIETTCVNALFDFDVQGKPLLFVVHWDPNQKNSPRNNVATYYCQSDFFVNVTYGINLNVKVYRGNGTLIQTNFGGTLLEYKSCSIMGQSNAHGLMKTKFHCHCSVKCHIIIKFIPSYPTEINDHRVCAMKIYD